MKRWALVVVLLYFLLLVSLTPPLLVAAFYPDVKIPELSSLSFPPWPYWLFLAVLVASQAILLAVPVAMAEQRPITRRSLLWPILASGFMMALLAVGAVLSVDEFIARELPTSRGEWAALGIGLLTWGVWGYLFWRIGRSAAAVDVITRQCRYLLQGSILGLLIAVPTHIVARSRNYCCAGAGTFLGIAFGLSVMLFSFGPGLFFLFAQRWQRLHPARKGTGL